MTLPILHLDYETRSTCDLKKLGAHIYAKDPTTDVWCAAYAFGDDPVEVWTPGMPCPPAVIDHVLAGGRIAAWNAQFERLITREITGPRYGWPVPDLEQYECTMAKSYALAMPGSLDEAGRVLQLDFQKDDEGHRLMLRMARPRRIEKDGTLVWWTDPEKVERLLAYCKRDVETERAADKKLLPLRHTEQRIYHLDQVINDRGVVIDRKLCQQAQQIVAKAKVRLDGLMSNLTGGAVGTCTSAAQLTAWLCSQGVETDSVAKPAVIELLERDLPDLPRRALELRQEAAKSSVAKIDVMLARSAFDGYMRGNLQYHGAGTGRWAARGAQLQNLPRPTYTPQGTPLVDVPAAVQFMYGSTSDEMLELLYAPALTVVADCIRGMIIAPAGKNIYAADFSSIEARVLAWLAGQHDVLNVFRTGADIYCYTASSIYAREIDKKKDPSERQVGKVSVLALGFQGGVGAFAAMAKTYNMKIDPAYPSVWGAASVEDRERAENAYRTRGLLTATELSREAWIASELIKMAWRRANPEIEQYWYDLEAAAIEAVLHPGRITEARFVKYRKAGSWLFCQLPSGRCIAYPFAKIVQRKMPWTDRDGKPVYKPVVQYMGVDGFTKKWSKQYGYGGLFAENVTQAVARDFMAEGMLRVEEADFSTAITIHDEIVTYGDEDKSLDTFVELMTTIPAWGEGCPVAAEGWKGKRYKK